MWNETVKKCVICVLLIRTVVKSEFQFPIGVMAIATYFHYPMYSMYLQQEVRQPLTNTLV